MNPHVAELDGRVSFSRKIGCCELESARYLQKIENFGPKNTSSPKILSFDPKPDNELDDVLKSAMFKQSEINSMKQENLLYVNNSNLDPDQLEQACPNNSYVSYSDNIDNISLVHENNFAQGSSRAMPNIHESASFHNPHHPNVERRYSLRANNSPVRKNDSIMRDICQENGKLVTPVNFHHSVNSHSLRNPSDGSNLDVEGRASFMQNSNGNSSSGMHHSQASEKNILRADQILTHANGSSDEKRKSELEYRKPDENLNSMHSSNQSNVLLSVPGRVSLSEEPSSCVHGYEDGDNLHMNLCEAEGHHNSPSQIRKSSTVRDFPSVQILNRQSINNSPANCDRENPHLPPKTDETRYFQGAQGRVSYAKIPEIIELDSGQHQQINSLSSRPNLNSIDHTTTDNFQGCSPANESNKLSGRVSFSQNPQELNPQANLDVRLGYDYVSGTNHSPARRRNSPIACFNPDLPEDATLSSSVGESKQLTEDAPNLLLNQHIGGRVSFLKKPDTAEIVEQTQKMNGFASAALLPTQRTCTFSVNQNLPQMHEHKSSTVSRVPHHKVNPHSSTDPSLLGNVSSRTANRVSYSVKTSDHELKGSLQKEDITLSQLITANDSISEYQVNSKSSKSVAKPQQVINMPNSNRSSNQETCCSTDSLNTYQQTDVTTAKQHQQNTNISHKLNAKRDLEDLNSPRYHLAPDVSLIPVTVPNPSSVTAPKIDVNHNTITYQRQSPSPNPHIVPNKVNHDSLSGHLQKNDVYHDSFCGHCANTGSSQNSLVEHKPKSHHSSLSGNLQTTEVYHDSLGGFSEGTEDMNLSSVSGYQRKLHVTGSDYSNEYQNSSHPMGSPVHNGDAFIENSMLSGSRASILKNSNVVSNAKNQYYTTSPESQKLPNSSSFTKASERRPSPRPTTSRNPGNRNPHAVLPTISPKPSSRQNSSCRPNSSYTPRVSSSRGNASFPPLSDRARYNRSVIWEILSEATDEDTYSLYSYSSGTGNSLYSYSSGTSGSHSDESLRGGSARRREETKRQRYWNWAQPGLTVDELARHRRKRPPSSQKPKDTLKVSEGSFAHLKTEYRRRYRRNSSLLKSLEKLKPEDLLRLEGELKCSAEYKEEFVEHPLQREKLLRRPTSLKLEGSVETSTEAQEKFKYEESEKSPLIKQEASLKPEGELLVKVSEVHDKFIEFPGVKRPELTRKSTSLKLEGPIETCTEAGDKFVQHPPQPLEKPFVRDPELSSATSPMAHEVTTEYRPEYKENYIAFEAKRPIVKKPEGSLKPEGTIEASTELKSEFKDFHPSRPVLHRNNSLLKPSGDFAGESEKRSEFRDFHPARPTIHRNNSLLKPSGEFERSTEKGSEYRDFHPSRPVLQRNNSQLRPSGDMSQTSEVRAEYKNFNPKRPIIHRVDSKLKPEGDMAKTTEVKSEYRDFHPSRPVLHRTPSHLAMEGQMEKESEIRAEYRDFHPSRPVIYRKNSLLKPEGDIEASTEVRSEYKDFHPSRPTIHRNNSLLKPEGEIGKESEGRSEYKDFHPGRPVIHRKNSMLHPEGEFSKDTEKGSEYKDFHPSRPVIHRKNSMLHPEGEFYKDTEKGSEYKDFHPSRPTIHRNNSLLRPEGDMMNTDSELKHEFKDHKPKRPTIYTENCNLKPGNRIEERNRALTPKSREYYVLEGEITIRPERSGGRALENIKNEERTSTAGRRLPGTSTLPRSRAVKGLLPDDNPQTTERPGPFRFTVENVDDATPDKAFVVLQDNNNNNNVNNRSASYEDLPEFQNRWLRGSLRERAEPWRPSWALNPNTKDVTTT